MLASIELKFKKSFDELENTLNKALSKVDNIIVLGDINSGCHNPYHNDFDYINTICEIYNLKNLIKDKTCFAGTHGSSIDVILTKKPRYFQHTLTCETGLSDHHHVITTFLSSHLVRLKPKKSFYRSYKRFDESMFLEDVKNVNFVCDTVDPDLNYESLINGFCSIIEKNAPLKQKKLKKSNLYKVYIENRYNKNPTDDNKIQYNKQRKKCVNLRKKSIKTHFKNITDSEKK